MSAQPEKWAVLGGGFLGMTLALRLAQHGRRVTLFEGAPVLGGLASAWNLGEVVWDRHYHVTLMSDGWLRSLLRELELEGELQWVETKTGFYIADKLYSVSNSVEFLRFPTLSLVEKIRLAATIVYASRIKDWKKLEDLSAIEWLERCCGKKTVEKIWLPLLRAKLGENYSKASAAFIWAIIARMYSARKQGMKKEMFGYVPGGYFRVLERFGQRLREVGVEIELGHRAERVEGRDDGVEIRFNTGRREHFDKTVLTMAAPLAARLTEGLTTAEQKTWENVQYQGIICASLLLKKPLASYYVTNITESWVPFTAVIEMSALVDRKHFGGNSLVYLPKYVPSDSDAFERSDEEFKGEFLAALERMYPRFKRSDLLCFKISRVRQVLPIPTLHYSEHVPSMTTSLPGVYTVNSSQIVNGTLNVNETIQLAERSARELLELPRIELQPEAQLSYAIQ